MRWRQFSSSSIYSLKDEAVLKKWLATSIGADQSVLVLLATATGRIVGGGGFNRGCRRRAAC